MVFTSRGEILGTAGVTAAVVITGLAGGLGLEGGVLAAGEGLDGVEVVPAAGGVIDGVLARIVVAEGVGVAA